MSGVHSQLAALVALAYFVGALPFGLIVGKLRGVDIRLHGSRNIGASNAGRVLGRRYFGVVFTLDLLKSLVPMAVASELVARAGPPATRSELTHLLWIGVGLAAVLGHVFPVYLKFRGGKGVATSAGVILGLWPYFTLAGLAAIGVFGVVVKLGRYISLGSIAAAISFPLAYVGIGLARGGDLWGRQLPLLVVAVALAGLVVWRHRENIGRLRAGTEHQIGARRSDARDVSTTADRSI